MEISTSGQVHVIALASGQVHVIVVPSGRVIVSVSGQYSPCDCLLTLHPVVQLHRLMLTYMSAESVRKVLKRTGTAMHKESYQRQEAKRSGAEQAGSQGPPKT
jgi:phosphoribosyl-AMP cyclohydrolase